jgi:hypothetical protein
VPDHVSPWGSLLQFGHTIARELAGWSLATLDD